VPNRERAKWVQLRQWLEAAAGRRHKTWRVRSWVRTQHKPWHARAVG